MPARILIIEDNPANLELMRYLLRAFGHTVFSADDGNVGVSAVRAERPDLIVCDVQLPGIDGFEIARQVKADANLRAIPLLAVTALAMVGDREKVMAAGFDGYVSKPIDPETFVPTIDGFLGPNLRSSQPAPNGDPASAERPRPASTGQTVLVVDDQTANLQFAVSLLEDSGYRVLAARNMHEGAELARRDRPDLILSDVWMSDGSGYELLIQTKADPYLRDIPFVLVSSTLTEPADRIKGLALGAARYLTRPIGPEQLLSEIEGCLPAKG